MVSARLPVEGEAVRLAIGLARGFACDAALASDDADRLAVIVEEWVANLIEHGGLPPGDRIGLRLALQPGGLVRITATDAGRAFDPRRAAFAGPDPGRGGGVGLELIRAWSRIAFYGSRRGRNRLVLEMPLA